jgi:hypothetical protein
LEQTEAEGRLERLLQVRREQTEEDQTLNEREKITGQEPVKNDLSLGEWTGEQEFDVGRLEHESALQKTFEHRTAQHDQCASDQALPSNQLPEHFVASEVEQKAAEAQHRGEPDEGGWPSQAAAEMQRPSSQQREAEIEQRAGHAFMESPHGIVTVHWGDEPVVE